MKHLIKSACAVSTALLAMAATGCSDNYAYDLAGDGSTGAIKPEVTVNRNIASRADGDISVNTLSAADLSMTISGNGLSRTWASATEYDPTMQWPVGNYDLSVAYGDVNDEGFNKPALYGSTSFTVKADVTTAVSVTASQINSMVSIVYTDAFKNYFTAYSAQLHSDGGNFIDYAPDETRPAYVKPGNVDLYVSVTKPGGKSAKLQPTSITAVAAHHYHITVDVNTSTGGVGDAQLVISFDDSMDREDVVIDLSDDILSAAAPVVTLEGPASVTFQEETGLTQPLGFSIIAMGGIKEVKLTTASEALLAMGWPAEVDLANPGASRAMLESLGVKTRGLWDVTPGKVATINLEDVAEHIKYVEGGDNSTVFTLVVKDKMTQVNETPVSTTLNCEPCPYRLSINQGDVWSNKASFNIEVPDGETPNITISANGGAFTPASVSRRSRAAQTVTLTGLTPATNYVLRLNFGKKYKEVSFTTESQTQVPNGDFEQQTTFIDNVKMNHGGEWTRTALASFWNTVVMTISEPTGWTTTNSITANIDATNPLNSWFAVPSVYNTDCKYEVTSIAVGIGGTETPAIFKGSAQSGSKAVRIRTVGWNRNGTLPDKRKQTAAGESNYYNNQPPKSAPNITAGKIALNKAFDSRPTALSLYYTFSDAEAAGETGLATVKLYNGSTVIGQGSAALTNQNSYTNKVIDITYSAPQLKADRLEIEITASSAASPKITNKVTRWEQEAYGAVLTVDNLTFKY